MQGTGQAAGSLPNSTYSVRALAVARGDLTGDGQPEMAVLLYCSPQPSNYFYTEVAVFGADGRQIDDVTPPVGEGLPSTFDPQQFSIQDGVLVTPMQRYAPGDTHASGPSIRQVVTWRWNGHNFVGDATP